MWFAGFLFFVSQFCDVIVEVLGVHFGSQLSHLKSLFCQFWKSLQVVVLLVSEHIHITFCVGGVGCIFLSCVG